MLSWTKQADGWYSNGYRITLAEPFRWLLLPAETQPTLSSPSHVQPAVSLVPEPLAVATTLTGAKREAELMEAARERARLRRRYLVQLGAIFAIAVLLMGPSGSQNSAVVFGAGLLAIRPWTRLVGNLLWRVSDPSEDLIYQ